MKNCALTIKIQRTDDSITVEELGPDIEAEKAMKRDLAEVNPDFFDLAYRFFEVFPRFKEIVFNSKISKDE